jgi:hypothetical protein
VAIDVARTDVPRPVATHIESESPAPHHEPSKRYPTDQITRGTYRGNLPGSVHVTIAGACARTALS